MAGVANSDSQTFLPLIPIGPTGAAGAVPSDTPFEIRESGRVTIEIVGICQATCPYCAQNSGKNRRKDKPAAYMPIDMFRSIIDRLSKSQAFISKKIDRVYLYNYGEPFLAPAINDYLEILREYGLYAVISSNFQKVPFIKPENLSVIAELIFSLSGMTEATYGRVHGGRIHKVLADFETFVGQMKRHAPKSKIFMAWHRYKFNEHEFWDGYAFSRKLGVGFIPSIAFLADLVELIQVASDKLPAERKETAERDLFFHHLVNTIGSYSKGGADYDCPFWDDVVIDERGKLLVCCGTDSQYGLGSALEMSYDAMRATKIGSGICKVCKNTGVAEWAHNNFHDSHQLPWPEGRVVDRMRLKMTYNKLRIKSDVRTMLNKAPFGEQILDIYRKFKHGPPPVVASQTSQSIHTPPTA